MQWVTLDNHFLTYSSFSGADWIPSYDHVPSYVEIKQEPDIEEEDGQLKESVCNENEPISSDGHESGESTSDAGCSEDGSDYSPSQEKYTKRKKCQKWPKRMQKPVKSLPEEFQNGCFLVLKSDYECDPVPAIWRIDDNTLLQKFTPHKSKDGKSFYASTSTYSGWTYKSADMYYGTAVKIVKDRRKSTVVVFNKKDVSVSPKR